MRGWLWCAGLVWLGACGRIGFESLPSTERDGGRQYAGLDAGRDAGMDAGMDAGRDAGMDAGMDAGRDAGRDAGMDAGPDLDAGGEDSAVDTGVDAGPPPLGDFCEELRPLASAPTIDGVLEPGLTLHSVDKTLWAGPRPAPDDHDAVYAAAYRPDGLYVYVKVEDLSRLPAPPADWEYCGDGVEVYLDADGTYPVSPSYDVPGTVQFISAAPVDDVTPVARASRWNNVTAALGASTSTEFGAFPTSDGYAFEAIFRAADMALASWTLTPGMSVGLALSVNVAVQANDPDAACGHRLGQYFNRSAPGSTHPCGIWPFCTVEAFCTVPLQP